MRTGEGTVPHKTAFFLFQIIETDLIWYLQLL